MVDTASKKVKGQNQTAIFFNYFHVFNKDYNVHRFALSAINGELLERERERKKEKEKERKRKREKERERERKKEKEREIVLGYYALVTYYL